MGGSSFLLRVGLGIGSLVDNAALGSLNVLSVYVSHQTGILAFGFRIGGGTRSPCRGGHFVSTGPGGDEKEERKLN